MKNGGKWLLKKPGIYYGSYTFSFATNVDPKWWGNQILRASKSMEFISHLCRSS